MIASMLLLAGCSSPELNTDYGVRESPRNAGSVNGVGVLADMFTSRGHTVKTWKRLSPGIRTSDVIVWAPDDFRPPGEGVRKFLEKWLADDDGRTLVYIGRDYDAAVSYWNDVLPGAPPKQAEEIERRLARAQARLDGSRADLPKTEYARWFTLDTTRPSRAVRQVAGPWYVQLDKRGERFDAARLGIELRSRLRTPTEKEIDEAHDPGSLKFEPLLSCGDDVLVNRVTFTDRYQAEGGSKESSEGERGEGGKSDERPSDVGDEFPFNESDLVGSDATRRPPSDSQIIVIVNGSFLLNLPLVNHEHRVLAGKLIDECGGGRLNVALLESGPYGVPVLDKDPERASLSTVLTTWPMNVIALHALGLGILFCFVFFPIFGRPIDRIVQTSREGTPVFVSIGSQSAGPSDFGKHIEALGELMSRTDDVQYAQARLQHYQQSVKRDSGSSHRADNRRTGDQPPINQPANRYEIRS